MTEQEILDSWKSQFPPAVPSEHMLSIYESNIVRLGLHLKGTWGIMGCTRELRTMACKYQRPVTCMDIVEESFPAFRPQCSHPAQEEFIHEDWLEINRPEAFELIIGEGSLIMIPQERHQGFIDNVHNMLKSGGHAILKFMAWDNKVFGSAEEVICAYRENNPDKLPLTSLRTHFGMLCLDQETKVIRKAAYTEQMEQLRRDKVITEEEYRTFLTFPMKRDLYPTSKACFEKQLNDRFDILSVEYAKDILAGPLLPFYTIRKR